MTTIAIIDKPRWSVSDGWLCADGIRQVKIDPIDRALLLWDKKRKSWVRLTMRDLNTMWTVS